MLVLSRKVDEDIVIGEGAARIVVRVVAIRGDKVGLGVEAPLDVAIHRREVAERMRLAGGVPSLATQPAGD